MNIKTKLKERLLEIPINSKAYREKYRLAADLDVEPENIESLLNELCEKNILSKKVEYICSTCKSTNILDDELLKEMIVEDDCFECDECGDFVNSTQNKTGYIFFDIKDKQALINW